MTDPARHAGSVVLVTGGASGIGRACADRLLAEGASVGIADVDADAVKSAAAEMGAPDRLLALPVDVRSRQECAAVVEETVRTFGRLTGVVHAAGVNQPRALIEDLSEDEWRRVIDINLLGTFSVIQASSPHLRSGGSIVTLASGGGRLARKYAAAYCVSKAGVMMLTKVAALELGERGVRVNAIAPGFIDTEMNQKKLTDERRASIVRNTPIGRVGVPDEIASVASFLLSEESAYISGDLIAVDGGVAAASRP